MKIVTPLDRAMIAVDELLNDWVAPAARQILYQPDNNAAEKLRMAIQLVARTAVKPTESCGWGVFQEERTNNRRDWPSGYTYTQVSAIFQRDLPVNSLKYLRKHRTKGNNGSAATTSACAGYALIAGRIISPRLTNPAVEFTTFAARALASRVVTRLTSTGVGTDLAYPVPPYGAAGPTRWQPDRPQVSSSSAK